jgi:hypothetical protein
VTNPSSCCLGGIGPASRRTDEPEFDSRRRRGSVCFCGGSLHPRAPGSVARLPPINQGLLTGGLDLENILALARCAAAGLTLLANSSRSRWRTHISDAALAEREVKIRRLVDATAQADYRSGEAHDLSKHDHKSFCILRTDDKDRADRGFHTLTSILRRSRENDKISSRSQFNEETPGQCNLTTSSSAAAAYVDTNLIRCPEL